MNGLSQEKLEVMAPAVTLEAPTAAGAAWKHAWSDRQSAFHRYAVVVLFGAACLMLVLLVVKQQQVIDSQRVLIRELFQDSQELNDMKIQNLQHAKPHSK